MMKEFFALTAIATFAGLTALNAWAEEPATDAKHSSQQEFRLKAEVPVTAAHFDDVASGFEGDSLLAPYMLTLSFYNAPAAGHGPGFWLDMNATFARYSLSPSLGISPGLGWIFSGGTAGLDVGVEVQDQKTISKAPFKDSQFDTWLYGAVVRARFNATRLISITLGGRYFDMTKTVMATFEELETSIDHEATTVVSPGIELNLPLDFKINGAVDFYSLGPTAIASKEFAYGIGRQSSIRRLNVGAACQLGSLGLSANYFEVLGVSDSIELAYQAPLFTRDYLLSPRTLTLGVSWTF